MYLPTWAHGQHREAFYKEEQRVKEQVYTRLYILVALCLAIPIQ